MPRPVVFALASVGAALVCIVSPASAALVNTIPSWDGNFFVNAFGENATPTYGQTITAPSDNVLTSFTFLLRHEVVRPTTVHFIVMAWNGVRVTGSPLFQTGPVTLTRSAFFEEYEVDTGGVPLTAGSQYALFFTTLFNNDGFDDFSEAAAVHQSLDVYSGGRFILNNSNSSYETGWTTLIGNGDLAFKAEFTTAAVPESSPVIILSMIGAAGVAWSTVRRMMSRRKLPIDQH